ncbi:GAF domain-containing protein, partial [Coxiella burnetii]
MVSVQQKKLQLLFSHISELIISPYKVDTVIEKIMEEVENFFTPTNWSLLRYDSLDDELFFVYAKGLDEEIIKGIRLKRGEGIAGTVAETGKSLFIRDCQNDPRFRKKVDRSFKQKTRSIIAVPIKFKDVLLGVLELVNLENNVY